MFPYFALDATFKFHGTGYPLPAMLSDRTVVLGVAAVPHRLVGTPAVVVIGGGLVTKMLGRKRMIALAALALSVAMPAAPLASVTETVAPLEALGRLLSSDEGLPALIGGCSSAFVTETLQERRTSIAEFASLDAARGAALSDTAMVRSALNASWPAAPFSPGLRTARARVNLYEQAVNDAGSPQEVADAFADFVQLAKVDDDVAVHVGTKSVGCTYSTGETIAIVLGLVLGVIPGLILIALLC